MSERQLHVFTNEVPDWVVAYDPEDAAAVMTELNGEPYDASEDGDSGGSFTQEPDDHEFTLIEEDETTMPVPDGAVVEKFGEYGRKIKMTNAAWIKAHGRGLLGSAEY